MPHHWGLESKPKQFDHEDRYSSSPIDKSSGVFPSSLPALSEGRRIIRSFGNELEGDERSPPLDGSQKQLNTRIFTEGPHRRVRHVPPELNYPEKRQSRSRETGPHDSVGRFWSGQRLDRHDTSEGERGPQRMMSGNVTKRLRPLNTRTVPTQVNRLTRSNIKGEEKQELAPQKQLEFKVYRSSADGERVPEIWHIQFDETTKDALKEAHPSQTPAEAPPILRRTPSDEFLRPCYYALYEEHQTLRKLVKSLRTELTSWKLGKKRYLPRTPSFEKTDGFFTELDGNSAADLEDEPRVQTGEPQKHSAVKGRRSVIHNNEDEFRDRIIKDQEEKIRRMERHEHHCKMTYLSLMEKFKDSQTYLNDQRRSNLAMEKKISALTKEALELGEDNDQLRRDVKCTKDSLAVANQDTNELKCRFEASRQKAKQQLEELSLSLRENQASTQRTLAKLNQELENHQHENRIFRARHDHLKALALAAKVKLEQAFKRQSQQRSELQSQIESKTASVPNEKGLNTIAQLNNELAHLERKYTGLDIRCNNLIATASRFIILLRETPRGQSQWRRDFQLQMETKVNRIKHSSEAIKIRPQPYEPVERRQEITSLQNQRDRLMKMALKRFQTSQAVSQRQSVGRAHFQALVEADGVNPFDCSEPVTQASTYSFESQIEALSLTKGNESTATTWESNENSMIIPKAKPHKKRPVPITTSIRPLRSLGQACRSERSSSQHNAIEKTLPTTANKKSISMLSKEILDEIPPASPGYFAWQDAMTGKHRSFSLSGMTPMYDEAIKWPLQFNDRARVEFSIIGIDSSRELQSFHEGQIVDLCIQPSDFWIVRLPDNAEAVPCLLPRNALAEICPHDHEYYKYYEVVRSVPAHYSYLQTLPHDFVMAAHIENVDSDTDKSDKLGDQVACVKSHNLRTIGWLPTAILKHVKVLPRKDLDANATLCSCDPPEAYTGMAEVLKNCYCRDSGLSLREGERVAVAHSRPGISRQSFFSVRPSKEGLFCVKTVETGQRGKVDAIYLRLLRQPTEPLASNPGDGPTIVLTPKFFRVNDQGFIEGEDGTVKSFRKDEASYYKAPRGVSDVAKKAWEDNTQKTNPSLKKWDAVNAEFMSSGSCVWKPWDNGIPGPGPYYIVPPDHRALPGPLRATLAVNPLGPRSGRFRARSRSLIIATEPELRLIKHRPDVGYQPISSISVSKARGYDSEPDSRQKVSITRKYIFRTSRRGIPEVIDAATELKPAQIIEMFKGMKKDPHGTDFMYNNMKLQWQDGEYKRLREFPWGQQYNKLAIIYPRPYHSYLDEWTKANQALTGIKDIVLLRGYNVAYSLLCLSHSSDGCVVLSDTDNHVEVVELKDGQPDMSGNDIVVCHAWNDNSESETTSDRNRQDFKSTHLDWQHPYLRTARCVADMSEEDSVLVLLRPSMDRKRWQCLAGDDLVDVEAVDLDINPPNAWLVLHDFVAKGSLKRAHTTPIIWDVASEYDHPYAVEPSHPWDFQWNAWDWLFPVKETVSKPDGTPYIAADGDSIGAEDWAYMSNDGLQSQLPLCELYMREVQCYVPRDFVEWENPHLMCVTPKQDVDCQEGNWLLVLKSTADGGICKLADGRIALVNPEDLLCDQHCISIVSLRDLLEGGYICIPDSEQHASNIEEIEGDSSHSVLSTSVKSLDAEVSHVSRPTEEGEKIPSFEVQERPDTPYSAIVPLKDARDSEFIDGLDKFAQKFNPHYSQVSANDSDHRDSLIKDFGPLTGVQPLRVIRKVDESLALPQIQPSPPILPSCQATPEDESGSIAASNNEAPDIVHQCSEAYQEQMLTFIEAHENMASQEITALTTAPSPETIPQASKESSVHTEVKVPTDSPTVEPQSTASKKSEAAEIANTGATDKNQLLMKEFDQYKLVIQDDQPERDQQRDRSIEHFQSNVGHDETECPEQDVSIICSRKRRSTIDNPTSTDSDARLPSFYDSGTKAVGSSSSVDLSPTTSGTIRRRSTVAIPSSQMVGLTDYLARNSQVDDLKPKAKRGSKQVYMSRYSVVRGHSTMMLQKLLVPAIENLENSEETVSNIGEESAHGQVLGTSPATELASILPPYERIIDDFSRYGDTEDRVRQEVRDKRMQHFADLKRQQATELNQASTMADKPPMRIVLRGEVSPGGPSCVEDGHRGSLGQDLEQSAHPHLRLEHVSSVKLAYEVIQNHANVDGKSEQPPNTAETTLVDVQAQHDHERAPALLTRDIEESVSDMSQPYEMSVWLPLPVGHRSGSPPLMTVFESSSPRKSQDLEATGQVATEGSSSSTEGAVSNALAAVTASYMHYLCQMMLLYTLVIRARTMVAQKPADLCTSEQLAEATVCNDENVRQSNDAVPEESRSIQVEHALPPAGFYNCMPTPPESMHSVEMLRSPTSSSEVQIGTGHFTISEVQTIGNCSPVHEQQQPPVYLENSAYHTIEDCPPIHEQKPPVYLACSGIETVWDCTPVDEQRQPYSFASSACQTVEECSPAQKERQLLVYLTDSGVQTMQNCSPVHEQERKPVYVASSTYQTIEDCLPAHEHRQAEHTYQHHVDQVLDFYKPQTTVCFPDQALGGQPVNILEADAPNGLRIRTTLLQEWIGIWQLVYWVVMGWMFLSLWMAREEWLDVNGLGLNAVLQARSDSIGGWEWSGWQWSGWEKLASSLDVCC